jgi:anti-anti-sigma factor
MSIMDLELSTRSLDGRAVVTVVGEVDLETASQLGDHALAALQDVSPHLAVDLSQVTFMDSTGLKVMLAVRKRAELADGSLAVVGATRTVRKVFVLTGLDHTFALYDTLDEVPALIEGAGPTT